MSRGNESAGPTGFGRDVHCRSLTAAHRASGSETTSQPEALIKARHWESVHNQPCRVINFIPFARVENGKVISTDMTAPYALVQMECSDRASGLLGAIGHKIDFKHLWEAFAERGDNNDVEVIIFWVKKPQSLLSRMAALFTPGLGVMLCKAGAYELLSDRHRRPELTGKARFRAEAPIMKWRPDVVSGFEPGPFFAEDMDRLRASRNAQSEKMRNEKKIAIRRAYDAKERDEIPEELQRLLDKLT